MAEGSTGEKTEEASPYKLRKAREKGQIAKSKDASSAVVFAGVFFATILALGYISNHLFKLFQDIVEVGTQDPSIMTVKQLLVEALNDWMLVSLPIVGTAFIVGLAINYAQVGFLFAPTLIKLDFTKLNPVSGLKQIFSKARIFEVFKQIVKFAIIGSVAYYSVKSELFNIVYTQRVDFLTALHVGASLLFHIVLRVGILFLLIAAVDYFWQKRMFKKKMMMSKYDVKQEYKETEGDPHVKGERKRLAQEMVMQAGQQKVAKSSAVVTNPVHIAVAMQYDKDGERAPYVVAKGLRKNAEAIKKIASQNNVAIIRNVPLAQSLNKLDIDEEIPQELYEAMAEVLNFVYELKAKQEKKKHRNNKNDEVD